MFSTYVFLRSGYTNPLIVLCLFVVLLYMVQLSIQRAFDLAEAKFKENNKSLLGDERMNKRRRCSVDDNGLCCILLSDHRCHCPCGCNAFSKEHVRCVHCQNYIIDNSTVCQCSFYVHPLTDDAICHMCHKERYTTFSRVERRHVQRKRDHEISISLRSWRLHSFQIFDFWELICKRS